MSEILPPSSLFSVEGRVVVVTGASSGLGDRFARLLHAAGAQVVGAARRVERLDSLAQELPGLLPLACDVTDDAQVQALADATVERFGRIDVLVNNAGYGKPMPAETEPLAHFRATLDVNLVGLYALTQATARHMIAAGGGTIVNIASILGLVASTPIKEASYCAAKGAVVNLTRELGAQWARKGIRVNGIAPGWFRSEMTEEDMFGDERSMEFVRNTTPMGRAGEAHELDGALLYLASDASSFVTGQTLVVDGGWTAR